MHRCTAYEFDLLSKILEGIMNTSIYTSSVLVCCCFGVSYVLNKELRWAHSSQAHTACYHVSH